jgi:hypothetical protein
MALERVEEEVGYFISKRKQRVREGLGTRYHLPRHVPMTYFFQLGPTS